MTNEITIPYTPHSKQEPFHNSKAKFRLICTGVGFGKSAAGVCELVKLACDSPSGCLFAIIAPTFPMVKNATLREFWKFCPPELIKNHNRSEHIISLINGVDIVYLSGDNERDIDRLRGLNLSGAYGDEIAMCPEYMNEIIMARLRDDRGPMRIWYTTTPKGKNWLYRLFKEKKKKDDTSLDSPNDYAIFGGSTRDNPHTPDEYKESMEGNYVGVFAKQELEGEFVGFEGLVYSDFSEKVHVIDEVEKALFDRVCFFIDWGYTNPMVCLEAGVKGDDIYILKEFYESKVTMEVFIDYLKSRKEFYGKRFDCCICDPAEPGSIMQLRNAGLRVKEGDNAITEGIREVALKLKVKGNGRPSLFVVKDCVNLINEFGLYRYPDGKVDRNEDEKPLKFFDHALDALRYGVMNFKRKVGVMFGGVGIKAR